MCLLSVFIFGFDKSMLSRTLFNILCQTEISILTLGFTVGFGSLFSKIWFVYTASIEKKKHGIKVSDLIYLFFNSLNQN
jgi:gamma-aminobutyric acid type B receptor